VRAEPSELARAQAMFLSNSLIGLRPAASLGAQSFAPWGELARLDAALD
jgi:hypothetical protein